MLEKSLHRSALEINQLVALRHPASSSHLHAGEILAQVCLRNQSTSCPSPPSIIISSTCWRNPCTGLAWKSINYGSGPLVYFKFVIKS
jgi:hypothetical protein